MINPLDLNAGVIVRWIIPEEVLKNNIDRVKIYRSLQENKDYSLLDTIAFDTEIPTFYKDLNGSRNHFYLVTFANSQTNYESDYQITFFHPSPYELKLISLLKSSLPDVLKSNRFFTALNDYDYLNGLNLALQYFNIYPPKTAFTLQTFPRNYEFLLFGLSLMFLIMAKYMPISFKDWQYSEPGGVSMTLQRGEKMQEALKTIQETIGKYLPLIKMDFSSYLVRGVGTVPLPLSLGGIIPQGVLNILGIFTAVGR